MLRCCKLPAACLSTEPQTRQGPPAFKGRTALGADDLAKGDAYGASFRPDGANVLQQIKPGAARHRRLGAHCRRPDRRCKAENGFSCGRFPLRACTGHWWRVLPSVCLSLILPTNGGHLTRRFHRLER
jgi:hypothetical protein